MALFEDPSSYPRFDRANSLRRSFAKVSGYLNYAVSHQRECSGKSTATRK